MHISTALIGMLSHQAPVVVSIPELLWHGGGNENGKPDPVYSVDYHPYSLEGHGLGVGSVLCTSGIDASIPPKGSVRVSSTITAQLSTVCIYSLSIESYVNQYCFGLLPAL